ncbi:hypothetical protein [Schlesneria paludicola]|uniref:hypothetical protein n=1 Tax=Schlesneria paludicola TaxID=360056 RepID=UPI000492C519|nr:hypothetical protein [Schlesneria paludicola]
MTRMSFVLLLATWLTIGCTSDPMGMRSSYRDRNVAPSAVQQPYNRAPVAAQPGMQGAQFGQPGGMTQSAILPQAALTNMQVAQAQGARLNGVSPYPMVASAGGQFDGRDYQLLSGPAQPPRISGRIHRMNGMQSSAIANGIPPTPQEDLKYRGGRTIKDLKFINLYVGGSAAWAANDWKSIDKALAAAMTDQNLNNVIMQYFGNKPISNQFLGSFFVDGWNPKNVTKNDLETQVQYLYRQKAFDGQDLPNLVVNFMLPRGTILADPNSGQQTAVLNKAIPQEEAEDSTGGLGGYHGSAHIDGKTIYYAVGVYSERQANNKTNGIPVFDANWKNVVATFYHELQEARTDPDVDDAITANTMSVLGWTSDSGQEIGDYPISEAPQLMLVFKEVPLTNGSGTVPIQLQYSNAVHGPEGPIPYPHGMEPGPGDQTPSNPPANNNPPTNPGSSLPANLPPQVVDMVNNWDRLDDYVRKGILKLLAP